MRFSEIEFAGNEAGTANIAELLATAKADLPSLEKAYQAAQAAQGRAENERMRLERLRGEANNQSKVLFARSKAAKRRALESFSNQTADDAAHAEYLAAKAERDTWLARLSFITSYTLEDANRDSLVAEIAERNAFADLLEGQAVAKRLALMSLSAAALAADEGAVIQLADPNDERGPASMSVRLSREVTRIRATDIPVLELKLRDHDRRVDSERNLVGEQLWV